MEVKKRIQTRNALLELLDLGVIDSKQFHTLIGYTAKKGYKDIEDILAVGIAKHAINVDLLPFQYGKNTLLYKAAMMNPNCINHKMYERLVEAGNVDKLVEKVVETHEDLARLLKNGTVDRRFIKKVKEHIRLNANIASHI